MKQFSKVLYRAITVQHSPEANLWFAVLMNGIFDASFVFRDKGFEVICNLIGLNPTWVRELLQDHHFSHLKKPVIDLSQDSKNSFTIESER